jgi:hypothetical protein
MTLLPPSVWLCAAIAFLAGPVRGEVLFLPFTDQAPVTTTESYSGWVSVSVSGSGQFSTSFQSDAFYFFSATQIFEAPLLLRIDGQTSDQYLVDGYPDYEPGHGYVFRYWAGDVAAPLQLSHGGVPSGASAGGLTLRVDRASLTLGGQPAIGSPVSLHLSTSPGGTTGALVLDGHPGTVVLDPATSFVLFPAGSFGMAVIGGFAVPPSGHLSLPMLVPSEPLLVGANLYLQAAFADTGAPNGLRASNGLHVVILPPLDPPPTGLAASPGATAVHLEWDPHPDAAYGYDVLRAASGGPPAFVARTWAPRFEDDHLQPGTSYEYEVRALVGRAQSSAGAKVTTTTAPSAAGLVRIPRLDVLVPIYAGGGSSYTAADVASFQEGIELARLFYLRNSLGRLHLDVTYMVLDAQAPPSPEGSLDDIAADLSARGILDDQFDAVHPIADNLAGCYGGFVILGQTAGSYGSVCGVAYPLALPAKGAAMAWSFTHEFQHALDLVIADLVGGHPEMLHGHPDSVFASGWSGPPLDAGEHYDWQRLILRSFDAYDDFAPPHRHWIEAVDADGDGLADADTRLAIDELRFGSSLSAADPDGDGLDDLAEMHAGTFAGSNPSSSDTDSDGLLDGDDPSPLVPIAQAVASMAVPALDGAADPGYTLLCDGVTYTEAPGFTARAWVGWSAGRVHLLVESNRSCTAVVAIDGSGIDGFWAGDTTYMLALEPGSAAARNLTEPQSFVQPGVPVGSLVTTSAPSAHALEATIPAALGQGFGYTGGVTMGLPTTAGTVWGVSIRYTRIGGSGNPGDVFSGLSAEMNEMWRYEDAVLVP